MTTRTKHNRIRVIRPRCKGCAFCVEFCPQHVLYQTDETNEKGYQLVAVTDIEKCTGCNMCMRVCPEFAIVVERADDKE